MQDGALATVLSFINCEKYPPSLLYLAMTLGPALVLLAAFERATGTVVEWITTFGRVPFFYYVVHIFLIHALAVVFAWATIGDAPWLLGAFPPQKPAAYGLGLVGCLYGLAAGDHTALSHLPVVCRHQAPPCRMVVELSLAPRL